MPEDATTLSMLFLSATEWEEWLVAEHRSATGIWLRLARVASGISSVTYAEALEVALCYGWIDGQKRALDVAYWLQRFTPRRPRSKWSQINRAKAEALIAAGRMQPPGLAEVMRAQADGRWAAAYASHRNANVPDDLAIALAANPAAAAFFETLDSRNRYAILYRIDDAKRPDTRSRRIDLYVAMLADQRRIYS